MKKLFAILLVSTMTMFSSSAFANDSKLMGTISSIDKKDRTFVVKDADNEKFDITVTPATDIEFDGKVMDKAKFTDLKVGQYVKIDYNETDKNKNIIAEDIEIQNKDNN